MTVTVCPSSTPTVVTVTVPAELSSVAFNTAPHESALVPIALIDGADVSTVKADDVTCAAALPAASLTSAVNVYEEPFVNACNPEALIVIVAPSLDDDPIYVALLSKQ